VLGLCLIGLTIDLRKSREDVLIIFKQLAVYGVAFAVFFGGSALHNDRRSRRILAVLSKAVGRKQYLCGLLTGIALALSLYCFCMGFTGSWVLGQSGFSISLLWYLMLCFMAASLLSAAVAVLFSTFLSPLFATLATGLFIGIPALITLQFGGKWAYAIPVYPLLGPLLNATFHQRWHFEWLLLMLAAFEMIGLWLIASWIFRRRDIAVTVE
jgi:MFS family permease